MTVNSLFENLLKSKSYRSVDQLPDWLRQQKSFSSQILNLRNLLGMTQGQLAKRASQTPRLIRRLESQEVDPQLSTLMKTAQGLECELVIRFVPKKNIPKMLKERAVQKVKKLIQLSKGTSALEEQEPKSEQVRWAFNTLVNEFLQKPSKLWDD